MTTGTPAATRRAGSWPMAGAFALVLAALSPAPPSGAAAAQLIPIKTAPVAEGDQFAFLPSLNLGMGGASIALADTLLDPFVNPAKGARLARGHAFGSPTFYSVSHRTGSGWTLPVGGIVRSGSTFLGLALAVQQLEAERLTGPVTLPGPNGTFRTVELDDTHRNNYALALAGHRFPSLGLSVGASASWSGLDAIDGVDQLYAGNVGVEQSGHTVDFRLGVLKDWKDEQALEALVVHHRVRMSHDVTFADLFWDPALRQPVARARLENDADRTRTWGLHLAYSRPLADSGWRIGMVATGNAMSHAALPGFDIGSTLGESGRSRGYNVGVGVSKSRGPSTVGLDVLFEPIRTRTWTTASAATTTPAGGTIAAGEKMVENDYRFANAIVRTGVSRDLELEEGKSSVRLQAGLQLRSVRYWLDQFDAVEGVGRGQEDEWLEWTRSWGAIFRFTEVAIHYRGRLTTGVGRPGVFEGGVIAVPDLAPGALSIAAVPLPMTLGDVSVVTHQFSISLPIR